MTSVAAPIFRPRRKLSNGHVQTVVGNFLRRSSQLPEPTTEFVSVPTPPEMAQSAFPSHLICHCHWQPTEAYLQRPTVVLVHGLEGSSYSQYVIGNSDKLWAAGCNIVRMNMRNCGHTDALASTLYHSGLSCDVLAVLEWLIAAGHQRVALTGYSMGGNLVLKAVGELGTHTPNQLKSCVAVSPPMDLRESADALSTRSNWVYEQKFLRSLKGRYQRKRRLFPSIFMPVEMERVRTIRHFDEYVMAPQCGFASADDYYDRAGSNRVLPEIAIPTLVLHAMDDPFIRLTHSTRDALQGNPQITLMEPPHGGHCAFLEDPDPKQQYDGYWAEKLLKQFVMEKTC